MYKKNTVLWAVETDFGCVSFLSKEPLWGVSNSGRQWSVLCSYLALWSGPGSWCPSSSASAAAAVTSAASPGTQTWNRSEKEQRSVMSSTNVWKREERKEKKKKMLMFSLCQFQAPMWLKSDWGPRRRVGQERWCLEIFQVSSVPRRFSVAVRNPGGIRGVVSVVAAEWRIGLYWDCSGVNLLAEGKVSH